MDEIGPGLWHWTALRETIDNEVSSYYLTAERIWIDPMLPPERPDWFRPEHAILTCRHHSRDAWRLGLAPWVVEQGAHELEETPRLGGEGRGSLRGGRARGGRGADGARHLGLKHPVGGAFS